MLYHGEIKTILNQYSSHASWNSHIHNFFYLQSAHSVLRKSYKGTPTITTNLCVFCYVLMKSCMAWLRLPSSLTLSLYPLPFLYKRESRYAPAKA